MDSKIEEIFGINGLLHKNFSKFEYRESQQSLATALWERLVSGQGGVMLAEAPTGLGKTFALLVPSLLWAIEHKKKILFLTANIPLQEQLFFKDIPQITEIMNIDVPYGILKGRNNYACIRKAEDLGQQGFLSFDDHGDTSKKILSWLDSTSSGDISELDIPRNHPAIGTITCTEHGCLGYQCPFRERCFSLRMIEQSRTWTVLISNYHLYFAYLLGAGKPFPFKPDIIICDEAHKLSDAARAVSSISSCIGDFEKLFDPRNLTNLRKGLCLDTEKFEYAENLFRSCLPDASAFFSSLENTCPNGTLIRNFDDNCRQKGKSAEERLLALRDYLAPFVSDIKGSQDPSTGSEMSSELSNAVVWYEGLTNSLKDLCWCLEVDKFPAWAYWRENNSIISKPTFCSDSIPDALYYDAPELIVMVSATLRVDGSFAYWERETGIKADVKLTFESPFPLERQMEIWVVNTGVGVTEKGYDETICRIIERMVKDNDGRTLILLSSMRLLNKVGRYMNDVDLGFPVFVQGDLPRNELLERFRSDVKSILVGSVSFREGIDVPGESLSQVIIDRIPFPHPQDPLVQARNAYEGRGAFLAVTLPVAKMYLRQAVGRLIRTSYDSGRVVILDGRVLSRPDWAITATLPKVKYKKLQVREKLVASKDSV